jgi:hypothetical protein
MQTTSTTVVLRTSGDTLFLETEEYKTADVPASIEMYHSLCQDAITDALANEDYAIDFDMGECENGRSQTIVWNADGGKDEYLTDIVQCVTTEVYEACAETWYVEAVLQDY